MTWIRLLVVPIVIMCAASPVSAGLFSRKPKPNPAERVPELLSSLKTSADESQRSNAAEELRQFDPKSHPEIMAALIEALSKDASTGVRAEAAASLGKLRPISQQAGYALEQAQNNDGSMRVRLAARQALLQYHLVGYRSGGKPDTSAGKDGAQTVSGPPGAGAALVKSPPTRIIMTPHGAFRETAEPPLADPPVAGKPLPIATPVARPKGPPAGQLLPSQPPELLPIPGSPAKPEEPAAKPPQSENNGPALPPPA